MSCPELTGRHVWMGELMVTRAIALGKKAAGKWARLVAVLGAVLAPVAFVAPAASASGGVSASGGTAATTDTSPVNLSANINMAAGRAAHRATVAAGDARFEVLAPDVIRLEYSPAGKFLDQPTYNILDRNLPVPPYTATRSDGWLTIRTSGMVLRYRLGSGAFSTANTQVRLLGRTAGGTASVQPSWAWECTYGQVCQSGAAALSGGAALATNHTGYVSPAGFIAGYSNPGDGATWQVLGAPAGAATITIRYSNYVGAIGGPAPRTMTLVVNGASTRVTLPPTSSWDDWATVTEPVTLQAGQNTVAVDCSAGDDCNVNVDDIAVTAPGATAAPVLPADPLGGYIRSFDSANGTYTASPSCSSGESNTTCQARIPSMAQGLLDKSGWYLLDDTHTAVWTPGGWIAPRPPGDTEDGYLFGYGENYAAALQDLARLTGPAPLLPEYAFGNWFSRYYPYTTSEYEDQLLPEFTANGVSLDTLSVDTDWKSPNQWDGWEWNPALFPDPSAFLSWAKSNGIHVTMNIHSSISTSDPQYARAQAIAGGVLASASCFSGPCAVWDWSKIPQAESNFAIQQPIQDQGVSFWWLDWCCDNSNVSMPGVTPDSWINHLYAQDLVNGGQRGFVLARIGASLQNSTAGVYPAGPWADHRSAIHFTGDTWSTWNTLAMQAQLAADEGSIGVPYVSDDIGGFLGPPSGAANDPDDLYLRWLQLGTFQPIMREHSNAGQNARLPWEYDAATQAVGDKFMRLRESLVPYLYTLAAQASATGLPMTRALYLDYPAQPDAYDHPSEYLLGSGMLVAPVTAPGNVASTSVWFPPGRWTDWFTGATFTGPSTQTLQVPLDRMPVFVKAGGIVPLQPSSGHASTAGSAPVTLRVFAGGNGHYTMYNDAGAGLGYQHGQHTDTPVSYRSRPGGSTVVIGPARGSYPGAPASRSYTVDLVDVSSPRAVLVDGRPLPASGWSYDSGSHTLQVPVGAVPGHRPVTITQVGGTPVQSAEPAATQLTVSPSSSLVTTSGKTTTVSATLANRGPGAVNDVSLGLKAPSGWTVTPATPGTAPSLGSGSSLTASWSVTAPSSPAGQTQAATMSATATYTDAATGRPVTLTAQQLPTPAITSVSPSTASAGQVVTVTGVNFGAVQGSSYLTFSDAGTNWGAPPDLATFSLGGWSDNKITFTVPSPSGTNGEWHVVPGSTATITVTTPDGTSNVGTLTISSG
jgi:alpha-glucosidase (family GH31 glycosyl hydrolase)